jgi:hypothetical protein
MKSIKTYARAAYCNRYALDHVTIDAAGKMLGWWDAEKQRFDPVELGHIDDCRTATKNTGGIRFYNRDFLVYTFGPE